MANRTTTNLAMSMQLPAADPYSILHASCWGNQNKEPEYIKTESIGVPTEGDLKVIEPHEYRLLDFGPYCPILPNRTSKMLIRDEYNELWDHVEDERHNPQHRLGGVVLTGHPGIGKSFGLYFYLLRNLLAAQPIALQTDKNSFFVFVGSGVYLIRFTSNTAIYDVQSHLKQLGCIEGMMALVDSSDVSPSPAPIFFNSRFPFYIVQATAPSPSRWDTWIEQSSASVLVTKPWSWSEIYIGNLIFVTPSPPVADLYEVFERYGPVPRVCFRLFSKGRKTRVYDSDILRASVGSPPFLEVLKANGFSENFLSISSILLMIPDGSRLPLVKPVSRHVAQAIGSSIPLADVSEMYRILDSEAFTRSGAAELFQAMVLQHILEGHFSYKIMFRPFRDSGRPLSFDFQPETDLVTERSRVTFDSLPKDLLLENCYVFEKREGLCSYDALLRFLPHHRYFHFNFLLKVVADYSSPVSLPELDKLIDKFPKLLPSEGNHWKLLFIIPSSMRGRFTKQPYVGNGNYVWEGSGYFEQVVACI